MKFKLKFLKPYKASDSGGRKRTLFFNIITGLLFVVILSYLLYIPPQKTVVDKDLKAGEIVEEDIVIKKDITVEDEKSTAQKREEAVANVIPIYEYDTEKQSTTRDLINDWFALIRQAKKQYIRSRTNKELNSIKENIEKKFGLEISIARLKGILDADIFSRNRLDLNELLKFVKSIDEKKIVTSRIGIRKSPQGTIRIASKGIEPVILKVEDLLDLKEVETALDNFLKERKLNDRDRQRIAAILMEFIDINTAYSMNLTREEETRVRSSVNPVLITLKTGQVILRRGDEVSAEDARFLQLVADAEKIREPGLSNFFLIMAILGFLSFFGRKFFKIWKSDSINRDKLLLVTGATLILSAAIYRLSLFLFPIILRNISIIEINYNIKSIYYAVPFGFGALIIAFTFTMQSAVVFSIVNAIAGAVACDWDFRMGMYILLGSLTVCYGIEYYQRLKRSPIIKAAVFWLLPANIVVIVLLNVTGGNTVLELLTIDVAMGIVSAIFALILASFIIPIWEIWFDLITELKLIELSNLNLPIFREMLEKAPGTYHHSQMVASLAEAAALDLDRIPLLVTTMALYHDIGKIDNPHLFTENHTIYKNPHDNFSPRESAKNITTHIPDGMERANKIKLPDIIKSSITQHHGNKLVRFFFNKAREMSSIDVDEIDETAFRYQGEKPQNIENAIIMLADQVEAATKSLGAPDEEEIKNVIQEIISANIEENQFDECEGLTFKALNIIAGSFHQKLSSIYHMRVSYPGFDFKEKKENNKK